MRIIRASWILGSLALLAGPLIQQLRAQAEGVLDHYQLEGRPTWHTELPKTLAEISGLAYTPDGQLLAHGDEQAVIWRIDPKTREVVGRFGLTRNGRVVAGDFEDIQVVGTRVFLLTSGGELLEGRMVEDGQLTEAVRRGPGLGGTCEAEGLVWDEATRSLLILCKQVQSRQWRDQVVILAISIDSWRFEPKPRLAIPQREVARATGAKRFHGSAMVRHPRSGTYLLVAGPERAFAEIDASGKVLGGGRLDSHRHRQPEGIAIAPDLSLLISDEAAGKRATISGYAYRP